MVGGQLVDRLVDWPVGSLVDPKLTNELTSWFFALLVSIHYAITISVPLRSECSERIHLLNLYFFLVVK